MEDKMRLKITLLGLLCLTVLSCTLLEEVNTSDAFLELYGTNPYNIYDGGANGTDGNDDDILSQGESVRIQIRTKNTGEEKADGVTVKITTRDEYLSIINGSQQTLGDMEVGPIYETPDANTNASILVAALPGTPNGHIAEFEVEFKDDMNNKWDDEFNMVVEPTGASVGLYGTNPYNIYDGSANGANGNDDEQVAAGETFRVNLRFRNQGSAKAMMVRMLARTDDEYVSVIDDSTYTFGDMEVGPIHKTPEANTNSALMLSAAANTPSGHTADIDVICTDKFNNQWTDRFTVIVQ